MLAQKIRNGVGKLKVRNYDRIILPKLALTIGSIATIASAGCAKWQQGASFLEGMRESFYPRQTTKRPEELSIPKTVATPTPLPQIEEEAIRPKIIQSPEHDHTTADLKTSVTKDDYSPFNKGSDTVDLAEVISEEAMPGLNYKSCADVVEFLVRQGLLKYDPSTEGHKNANILLRETLYEHIFGKPVKNQGGLTAAENSTLRRAILNGALTLTSSTPTRNIPEHVDDEETIKFNESNLGYDPELVKSAVADENLEDLTLWKDVKPNPHSLWDKLTVARNNYGLIPRWVPISEVVANIEEAAGTTNIDELIRFVEETGFVGQYKKNSVEFRATYQDLIDFYHGFDDNWQTATSHNFDLDYAVANRTTEVLDTKDLHPDLLEHLANLATEEEVSTNVYNRGNFESNSNASRITSFARNQGITVDRAKNNLNKSRARGNDLLYSRTLISEGELINIGEKIARLQAAGLSYEDINPLISQDHGFHSKGYERRMARSTFGKLAREAKTAYIQKAAT